ncbi:MAG TPA: 50S ribosomal protein L6 [bacterium]|jgi:large subunit ribosomal protein L6
MSRVGKAPIALPKGVEATVAGAKVEIKGPKGHLSRTVHPDITVHLDDSVITVRRPTDLDRHRALHGLTRALLANMVKGVTDGFRVDLEIYGVGYRAAKAGNGLALQLGFSHPVNVPAVEGISFEVPQPNRIGVVGIDKELVGQVAARIRAIRKPDPYKGKGVRYAGERIKLKAGKAGKGAVGKT